jgi:undecaprenyl-diphosphatase
VKIPHLLSAPEPISGNFITAVIVSCVTGLVSIGFLLRYLASGSFLPFVIYRIVLAGLVVAVALAR